MISITKYLSVNFFLILNFLLLPIDNDLIGFEILNSNFEITHLISSWNILIIIINHQSFTEFATKTALLKFVKPVNILKTLEP